jgi:hypothetical protein
LLGLVDDELPASIIIVVVLIVRGGSVFLSRGASDAYSLESCSGGSGTGDCWRCMMIVLR